VVDGFSLDMQKGVIDALKADASVSAIVGARVYDEPPQDDVFPYIRIGSIDEDTFDTSCTSGAELVFGVQVFSRPDAGRVEISRLTTAIRAVLHQNEAAITLRESMLSELRVDAIAVGRSRDGKSYEASIAVFAQLDPAV